MTTNANLPAMPQTNSENLCMQTGTPKPEHSGFTKREMFAMTAMQGLLVNAERNGLTFDTAPAQAVKCADALLAELERTK
jgi:hypothetical protein